MDTVYHKSASLETAVPTLSKRLQWAYQAAQDHDLTHLALSVLLHICYRAGQNKKGKNEGRCWDTQDAIADALVVSRSTVIRAISVLEQRKLILSQHRFSASTIYIPVCNLAGTPTCCTVAHPLKDQNKKVTRRKRVGEICRHQPVATAH